MHFFDLEAIRRLLVEVPSTTTRARRTSPIGPARPTGAVPTLAHHHASHELRTAEWLRDGDGWVATTLTEQTVARRLAQIGQDSR
jgi:hypothetical protein